MTTVLPSSMPRLVSPLTTTLSSWFHGKSFPAVYGSRYAPHHSKMEPLAHIKNSHSDTQIRYDNEWGYSRRVLDLLAYIAKVDAGK